jgi:hypothetical protein
VGFIVDGIIALYLIISLTTATICPTLGSLVAYERKLRAHPYSFRQNVEIFKARQRVVTPVISACIFQILATFDPIIHPAGTDQGT